MTIVFTFKPISPSLIIMGSQHATQKAIDLSLGMWLFRCPIYFVLLQLFFLTFLTVTSSNAIPGRSSSRLRLLERYDSLPSLRSHSEDRYDDGVDRKWKKREGNSD
ncbi:conserved hypothetical protein, partial [Trichinella spiralis]|uniref:hypothetical protein n=1 Tax=Trichinella spiralis TaxID=6334 RepID=UPI0001EFD88E